MSREEDYVSGMGARQKVVMMDAPKFAQSRGVQRSLF